MSVPWLKVSNNLKTAVKVINSFDTNKFPLLLSRIFYTIQHNKQDPFSEEELQKLEKSLKVTNQEIKIILECFLYIVRQSKYFLMKPTTLQEELVEKLQMDQDKAETFVKLWTENLNMDFDNFQNRTKLQSFTWELNLEAAKDCDLKTVKPTSVIQLQVKDSKEETQNVVIEVNEQQLLELYNNIESMQSMLDNINK